jgi:hypothetical protein
VTTVYAVSAGQYSDYSVHAVYETKELAEQAAEVANANSSYHFYDYFVEEFEMFDQIPVNHTVFILQASIMTDGTLTNPTHSTSQQIKWDGNVPTRVSHHSNKTSPNPWVRFTGPSREAVTKAYADMAAQAEADKDLGL